MVAYPKYNMFNQFIHLVGLLFMFFIFSGCATFYQRTAQIQDNIASGHFEKANQQLESERKWRENNHRVLYYMNRGVVLFMLEEYQKSIEYFNQADYYIEDYKKSLATEALVLISNPMTRPYPPEDFETIMIHYYKALNFIALENYEGALVECRRVNIRLQEINDQHRNHENKYARDAFAHNLMGIIYQATGDYNNAFIAYRNALDVYNSEYTELFNLKPPVQLKKDLLYTGKRSGFHDEVQRFQEQFGISVPKESDNTGDLLYIWMNGMGPVKSEWSVNLTNMGTRNGMVIFGSNELGITFPLSLGSQSSQQRSRFQDLSVIRVAFPKYIERTPFFTGAQLRKAESTFPLEKAQDINKIAFQSLNDRMLREIGNNLLRLATKQLMEHTARRENKNLGALVSVINALTERADTRNWQSLPYSLSYTRVPLTEGKHELVLEQRAFDGNIQQEPVHVEIEKGQTTFRVFHQMETR